MKRMIWLFALIAIPACWIVSVALGQDLDPADPSAPFAIIGDVIDAVHDGNWTLVASFVLMVLSWFGVRNTDKMRKWFNAKETRKKYLGWAVAAIAAAGFIATGLGGEDPDVIKVVIDGVQFGAGTVGLYSLVWKPFFGKSTDDKKPLMV